MILFLDFDGVLHPDHVYTSKRGLELRAPGNLLMHAPILESILDDHDPHGYIKIVLSTSWLRVLGFDRTKGYLSDSLVNRVIGATWHSWMAKDMDGYPNKNLDPFNWMTRYQQIEWYLKRNPTEKWLALDDLHSSSEGWRTQLLGHLIWMDPDKGLGCPEKQSELRMRLGG